MNLTEMVEEILGQVSHYLRQIPKESYHQPLEVLSQASIGQHTRHIIEFFECLLTQYPSGVVNYDLRKRDSRIEADPEYALGTITELLKRIPPTDPDIPLKLQHNYGLETEQLVQVKSTLGRELVYNVEHTLHHLAMVKIGLREGAPEVRLPDGFGVAPSTLRYQSLETID